MRCRAAVMALVTVFVALRVALLVSSYDANNNWEEPVFLSSALDLARDGMGRVLDYQDDLNHGGSVVLLVLAVPWIHLMGTSLVALKGIAVMWSALTLVAFVSVAWRHWSPRVALWVGLCFTLASPTLARLNVTLVGSHPESLLPVALALDAYLTWAREHRAGRRESPWCAIGLGLWSGLGMWMSYVSALFIVPVLVLRTLGRTDRPRWALVGVGGFVGIVPWMVQNLWLRPHGAWLWRTHVTNEAAGPRVGDAERIVGELAASFGWASPGGECLLVACAAAVLVLTVSLLRSRDPRVRERWWDLVPFAAAPYLGLIMLLASRIAPSPAEGYYYGRFYVALQMALFWVLVLAADLWTTSKSEGVVGLLVLVLAGSAFVGQFQLLGRGTSYVADLEADRAKGCMVFGVAEADRARDWPDAARRLANIDGGRCRDRAFAGLGWGIGSRFLGTHDLEAARNALLAVGDTRLRWAACGGFHFLVHHGASPVSGSLAGQLDAMVRATCPRPPA